MLIEKLGKLFRRKKSPPVLMTQWGPVTESARLAAALRMRQEPEVMRRVLDMISEDEARRRYPEAFDA